MPFCRLAKHPAESHVSMIPAGRRIIGTSGVFLGMALVFLAIIAAAGDPPSTQSSSLPSTEGASPYMILIGDSIAEGHPALHGRLHPGLTGVFNPSHVDQPGQLGFELAQRLGLRVINQGIGSQSSKEVRARWARDVLGVATDPDDGRGTRTLNESGTLPRAAYVHVGINDFSLKVPASELKANFVYFAESCQKSGIRLIIDNIGAESDTRWLTPPVRESIQEFNHWLSTEFSKQHPEVLLIDYCSWSTAGTGDVTQPRAEMFADDVHPNQKGYAAFAEFAAERVGPYLKRRISPTTQPTITPQR
jgi:lysophospholipase L1-like esterase